MKIIKSNNFLKCFGHHFWFSNFCYFTTSNFESKTFVPSFAAPGAFIEVKIDDLELLEAGDIDQNLNFFMRFSLIQGQFWALYQPNLIRACLLHIFIDAYRTLPRIITAYFRSDLWPYLLTASWELWKHSDPVPGGRPIFFKPKWPKESKNGFKTISCRPPLLMIFSKNCFSAKKIVETIGRLVDFWIP